MILVVGATGYLGGEVCRLLRAEGKVVKALVRPTADRAKIENLKNLGVTLVEGDLKEGSSLDAACKGVTTVISTANSVVSRQAGDSIQTVDHNGQLRLVEAAKNAKVSHFIYISYSGSIDIGSPLGSAKRAVEQRLAQSGMTFTILRPTFFMEVWLSPVGGFDVPNGKMQIFGEGDQKISWISFRDVAKFVVQSVDNPAARNATLELGGPQALSPLDVKWIFEELTGKPIQAQHVPEQALQAQKESVSDPLQQSFAAFMLSYAKGDSIDMKATVQRFPVELTSVKDYAKQILSK